MLARSKKTKYNSISHTCKTIAGSLALMTWLLMFFAGSLKANAATGKFSKTGISELSIQTNSANLPADPSEPLPLPEEPDACIAALEDAADDDKKAGWAAYFIQLVTLQQITEVQAVQSFHYHQSIQQRIAIPLFVLHHSWKSYLI